MTRSFPLPTLIASAASIGGFMALGASIRALMVKNDKALVVKTAAGIGLWTIFLYAAWGLAGQEGGRNFHEYGMESFKLQIRSLGIIAQGL